jgi:hypothetical protein
MPRRSIENKISHNETKNNTYPKRIMDGGPQEFSFPLLAISISDRQHLPESITQEETPA